MYICLEAKRLDSTIDIFKELSIIKVRCPSIWPKLPLPPQNSTALETYGLRSSILGQSSLEAHGISNVSVSLPKHNKWPLTFHRDLYLQYSKMHSYRRVFASHSATWYPQPRRSSSILYRMCSSCGHRRRIKRYGTQGGHTRSVQGHRSGLHRKYLQQLQ